MHPISADTPQECTDITAQVFQSLRFDTTHYIPSYQHWIDDFGHLDAIRFHRRFLQHLDNQFPGHRWVLKCPDHVFTLDAVREVYPDARIVVLHRDPISVLASVAKLTYLLRRPFTRCVDRLQIGRQISERWLEGTDRMLDLMRRQDRDILHIHYSQLISNPSETVRKIYNYFSINFAADYRHKIQTYNDGHLRGGYEEHSYSLSEFGLDASLLRLRFARYLDEICCLLGSRTVTSRD
jgi:hypothetical protein